MMVRGIRGATTVENNSAEAIIEASQEMLQQLVSDNDVNPENISQIWFTVTQDLNAAFPARSLRNFRDFQYVPVMCATEINVPESLEKCIRVMVSYNTTKKQKDIRHVYLRDAVKLRPDLSLTKEGGSR
ncbi:chorismate mutase [Salisediminibacterium beveridgei]|uniref:chorismate mutase n=1 Tax=Salisediminibacterium beveridgei TaxID=632773 RepID=A0A1D7QUZ8_9BACI|nr:chorismate mutase [Salisediminibacterium beveridgei]AOM82809.1 Chorismate mutase II [Salisediminibacterium beveridgei]